MLSLIRSGFLERSEATAPLIRSSEDMMASIYQNAKLTGLEAYLPSLAAGTLQLYRQVFEAHRQRIYSLCFWMTDNEIAAEELMQTVFQRVFSEGIYADAESVDKALVAELRENMEIGSLTLECAPSTKVVNARRNTMRIHLERAVVQLPPTERLVFLMHDVEGFDERRISRTLEMSEGNCRAALHQARLKVRELLSRMS